MSGPKRGQRRHESSNFHVTANQEKDWCDQMGLNQYRLREAHQLCDDIHRRLISLGYFAGEKVCAHAIERLKQGIFEIIFCMP